MERYNSGTSLSKTAKEDDLEFFERMLHGTDGLSDELFVAMKKLTIAQIRELHRLVAEMIAYRAEKGAKKS